jgi:hypothetical protein
MDDVLSIFEDGVAPDSERLGGVTATGYLKPDTCPLNEVFKAINPNATPDC